MPEPLIQTVSSPRAAALVGDKDGGVLVHPVTGLEYRLNRTGIFLWNALQQPATVSALRDASETAETFVNRLS